MLHHSPTVLNGDIRIAKAFNNHIGTKYNSANLLFYKILLIGLIYAFIGMALAQARAPAAYRTLKKAGAGG